MIKNINFLAKKQQILNIEEQIKKNNKSQSRRNLNNNIRHYIKTKTSRNKEFETERILDFSDSESKRYINKIKSVVL